MKLPQKPGAALNKWLQSEHAKLNKGFARRGLSGRKFPQGFGVADWPMIETVEEDGTIRIDYQGDPHYSKEQIADYVRKFCELNNLKGA